MSDEVVGLEGKSIIVHEDVMPEQVNGKLVYPRAYFEADVKELVKMVRRETLKEVTGLLEKECKKYVSTPIGLMLQGIKEKIIMELQS